MCSQGQKVVIVVRETCKTVEARTLKSKQSEPLEIVTLKVFRMSFLHFARKNGKQALKNASATNPNMF